MRQFTIIAVVLTAAIAITATTALAGNGYGAGSDESGFRWARDDDGDGIPNGLDPDWTRPRDGTGYGPGTPFFGPTLLGAFEQFQRREMNRRQAGDTPRTLGDVLRQRLRSRDGSCSD